MRRLTDAHDVWDRLRFPPPWWELPLLAAIFAVVGEFWGPPPDPKTMFVVYGIVMYLANYFDGQRALLHRLDTRLAELDSRIDTIASSLGESQRIESRPTFVERHTRASRPE